MVTELWSPHLATYWHMLHAAWTSKSRSIEFIHTLPMHVECTDREGSAASFLNMWWSFCAPQTLLPLLKLYLAKVPPWCGYFVRPHGHRCLRSSIAQRRSAWTCEMERYTWQVGILRWMQTRQLSKRCNRAFERIPSRVVALSTAKLVHQIACFRSPIDTL